ncbi:MAG: class I SAM-dependent methyltransferase, partial [Acidobacteriaceae bacterium]
LSDAYDTEVESFWEIMPSTFINKFAELAGKKVLDVGSGSGRDALILKKKRLEVVCLDASKAMIDLCWKRGLQGVIGDFSELPFEDASFDSAWAYTSLLHVPKAEVASPLKEIYRILKPGGMLGLGMIEGDWEGYYESSDMKLPRWFSFYKREELEGLLKKGGFELVYFEVFQAGKSRKKNYLNFIAKKI